MALLPEPENTTLNQIWKFWESEADNGFREHLGASIIGRPCSRSIWYSFRWTTISSFPGRILRLFDRGQREEHVMTRELRGIGCHVEEIDKRTITPENPEGDQFRISAHGGHFGGSCDGLIFSGVPEAPKSVHVAEYKTHNEKSFKALVKAGVEESKPEHYAQMIVYMGGFEYDRALYVAVNKNTDELYIERVRFDRKKYDSFMERANMIIATDTPPPRISDDPGWYQCKFCDHSSVCHDGRALKMAPPTCRTCIHSTPELDGDKRWSCSFHNVDLNKDQQLAGCQAHAYNPAFIETWADATDAIDDAVEYTVKVTGRRFLNGPPRQDGVAVYSSIEMYKCETPLMLGDPIVDALKAGLGGELVESVEAGPDEGDQISERGD